MRTLALVYTILACAGHARRWRTTGEHRHDRAMDEGEMAARSRESLIRSSRSHINDSQAAKQLRMLALMLSPSRQPQAGFAGLGPDQFASTRLASVNDPFPRHYAPRLAPLRCRSLSACMALPRTFIMIKPDGVQRSLVGDIIKRFEQRGYQLKGLKLYQASEELLREHYKDLVDKKFFPDLLSYMLSGPVVCMVWEGVNVVKMGRQMLGATNPQESLPGTIRGDFSIEVGRNICHGSDSPENAEREIKLWFKEDELTDWKSHSEEWVYRDYE